MDEVVLKNNKVYIKPLNFFQLSRIQLEEIVGDSVKILWPSYITGKKDYLKDSLNYFDEHKSTKSTFFGHYRAQK